MSEQTTISIEHHERETTTVRFIGDKAPRANGGDKHGELTTWSNGEGYDVVYVGACGEQRIQLSIDDVRRLVTVLGMAR